MLQIRTVLMTIAVCFVASGCASTNPEAAAQNDPFEKTNRQIFDFNMKLEKYVARPVTDAYVYVLPEFARDGIHNFLHNLGKPVTLGNEILQGEGTRAGQTLARIVTNTTLGLGGFIDVATNAGVPDNDEDFGQTLGVWGFGEGPYLMLPFLGPSNPRDAIGMAGDFFMDPLTYAHYDYENLSSDLRFGFGMTDKLSGTLDEMDSLKRTSLDFYATSRSLYRQFRKAQISNGADMTGGDAENMPEDLPDDMPDDTPQDPAKPAPADAPKDAPADTPKETSGN